VHADHTPLRTKGKHGELSIAGLRVDALGSAIRDEIAHTFKAQQERDDLPTGRPAKPQAPTMPSATTRSNNGRI
jgi:hypothetical protein